MFNRADLIKWGAPVLALLGYRPARAQTFECAASAPCYVEVNWPVWMTLDVVDAAELSFAVIGVWVAAWGVVALRRTLTDEPPTER